MKPDFFNRSVLARQLLAFRKEFFWAGVFSLFVNVLMLSPTIYMLQLYGRVMKSGSELTLLVITLFLVLFCGVMAVAEWLRSVLLVRTGVRLDDCLNSKVFRASFDAYLKNSPYRVADAFSDLGNIRLFLTANGIFALFDTPWTPVYIAVIFLLNPFLGWLSVLFAIIQLGLAFQSSRMSIGKIESAACAEHESDRFLQGKLHNIEPVYAMGMTKNVRNRWYRLHDISLSAAGASFESQNRQQSIAKFVRYSMQSLTLAAGALMVIDGRMSAGSMIATNILMSKALQPLDLMVAAWKPFMQARTAFLRLERLLEEFPERKAEPIRRDPAGEIRLEGVTALAGNRTTPVLKDIHAVFSPGEIVAVLGPTGSGKSTLARCIVGIWPERKGRVLIDGKPVESWQRSELGPHIGYLPQDIELFEGSIAENIARFSRIDSGKVIEAAKKAGIHEMIVRFPLGYDTWIGEDGGTLSGGQRQRLGLARALYGNPSLIVLDEPNANLDENGDRSLIKALRELRAAGKTVILVTHRPGVLEVADRKVFMQSGRIVGTGEPETVIPSLRSPVYEAALEQ
jgi:ATP-binding cassette, subfamily C, bacterial exporter for protease/lipase